MLYFAILLIDALSTVSTERHLTDILAPFNSTSCVHGQLKENSSSISFFITHTSDNNNDPCEVPFGDGKVVVNPKEVSLLSKDNVKTILIENYDGSIMNMTTNDILAFVQTHETHSKAYVVILKQQKEKLIWNITTSNNAILYPSKCHSMRVVSCPNKSNATVTDIRYVTPTLLQCTGYGIPPLTLAWKLGDSRTLNTTTSYLPVLVISLNLLTGLQNLTINYTTSYTRYTCHVTDATGATAQQYLVPHSNSTSYRTVIYCMLVIAFLSMLAVAIGCLYFKKCRKKSSNTTQTSKSNERIYESLPCNEAGSTLQNQLKEEECDTRRGSHYVSCYNTLPTTLSRDDVCDAYNHLDLGKGEISNLQQIKRNEELKALSLSRGMQSMEGVTEGNTGRVKCKVIVEMEPTTTGGRVEPPQVYEYMG